MREGKGDYMGEITVTFSEYIKEQMEFANRHVENGFCRVHTKTYGEGFRKEFQLQDGARWYEITMPVTEEISAETHGIAVKANVKLWRTQYWSSENEEIKCFYEQ